jgi:hypothetical protein
VRIEVQSHRSGLRVSLEGQLADMLLHLKRLESRDRYKDKCD